MSYSLSIQSTVLTPASAPRVLDQPVLLAVLSPVSDGQHSVVQVGAAVAVVDAAVVKLEVERAGVDGWEQNERKSI